MGILDDWDINFNTKVISHKDGVLLYDTNSGTAPSLGDYIRGATSGVVGKVIAGDDLGGTNATGELTLTNVTGRFENNESLVVLDSLGFDTVANGGFAVGDTLDEQGAGTGSIIVYAIEYNNADDGTGTIYGVHSGDSFINNDVLDINGGTTDVAATTGAETAGANFTGALANGVLSAPSRNIILNYDQDAVGTAIAIPRFCTVQNASYAPTVSGFVQKVFGAFDQGSLRLNDAERSQWLLYDAETAAFSVGYQLTGGTSGAKAEIVLVVDNGTEGALLLKQITGIFEDNETITDNQSTPGSATANGTVGETLVPYDNEATGPFTVGNTLTNTTDGSTTGIIRGLQDDGATGLLVVSGVTSKTWANNDAIGDGGATANINGSVSRTQWLLYDAETVAFTVGLLLTGGTSTATGYIVDTIDNGTEGAVELMHIVGTFQDNETITDSGSGSATSNGTVGEVLLTYDGETSGPFTVGNTLTNTTDSSTTGTIRGLQDDGATGTLVVEEVGSEVWKDNDAITDGTASAAINGRVYQKLGDWSDNDEIYVADTITYDNLQAGQSFKLNDIVTGEGTDGMGAGSNGAQGKIISVDAANSKIVMLNILNRPFVNNEQLHVNSVYIADVEAAAGDNANFVRLHADCNQVGPGLIKTEQTVSQGGLYDDQLNAVRDANQFYTMIQDEFDELGALDDEIPLSAQVRLQQYTLINSWKIPDLSFRFLESGSIQDSALNNIWTNFQTLGSVGGIEDISYGNTTPQPQIYIEQNGSVLDTSWLEGQIDVLAKVKSNSLPTLTTDGTGAEINSGTVTIFVRRYGDTYDHFTTTTIAGVAPIPLATATDINNTTGTHSFAFDGGSSGEAITVGEEIVATGGAADPDKRGVVTSYTTGDSGVTGTIEYILTGGTQFLNDDIVTGQTTGFNKTVNGAPTTLVAGYGTDIVVATVQQTLSHAGTTGTFVEGELVNQAVSGASAILMADSGSALTLGNVSGTFDNTNTVTGATSGATATANGSPANVTTINRDIGDGNGVQPYNAVIYMDRTGASAQTLADMYEWIKYRTRRQEEAGEPAYNLLGGKGDGTDGPIAVQGRIYITLDDAYALVKASPFGTFAGGTFFGARGVFIQDMAAADIRNYQLIDANGTLRNPPNQQSIVVNGLASGDRVAVFRRPNSTPGSGILTNEYSVNGNQSNGAGTVVVDTTISSDTPSSGVLRIYNNLTQVYDSYAYTSFATSTFTLSGTLSQQYDDGATPIGDVYVPLIQEQSSGTSVSVNIVYSADIPLLARVRQKGILPFEVESTFTSTGAIITAIRTTDTIVD